METVWTSSVDSTAFLMDARRPTPIVRDAHALLVRGIDALERSRIEDAVGLLQQAVTLDPRSFHAHLALGISLTKALRIPEAETALQAAIELEPKNFWAHLRMAELFKRVGVPTRAEQELRLALDLAQGSDEKKIARDLLETEKRRNPRRAWRPDFSKLLGRKRAPQ